MSKGMSDKEIEKLLNAIDLMHLVYLFVVDPRTPKIIESLAEIERLKYDVVMRMRGHSDDGEGHDIQSEKKD